MSQPEWEFVANIGDVHPLDYGGYFIFRDKTGVYPPEAEYLQVQNGPAGAQNYTAYRFPIERCTFEDGVLSDNAFHPEISAWFANDLDAVASSIAIDITALRNAFTSHDTVALARAYQAIGDHHGWENLDQYPIKLTYTEARERYKDCNRTGPLGAFIP